MSLGENKNINYSQKYAENNKSTYDSDGDGLNEREDRQRGLPTDYRRNHR